MKNTILKVFVIIICGVLLYGANCQAASLPSVVPAGCQGEANLQGSTDVCNLTTVETMALNVVKIILGISGSLALLMFVYGGLLFIIAGGKEDYYGKAKNALVYATIGLVIVLCAGVIVKEIFKALNA